MHLTILQQESCQGDPRFCHINNLDIQTGLTNRKIGFTPWQWEEEIIVLSLDYFSFPFAILVRQFYIRKFCKYFFLSIVQDLKFLQKIFLISIFLKWTCTFSSLLWIWNSNRKTNVKIKGYYGMSPLIVHCTSLVKLQRVDPNIVHNHQKS